MNTQKNPQQEPAATLAKVYPFKTRSKKRRPRRVNFDRHDDNLCGLAIGGGLGTNWISEKTGLSPSQVTYRAKLAGFTRENGCSRSDFRNGRGPFAAAYIAMLQQLYQRRLHQHLRKFL